MSDIQDRWEKLGLAKRPCPDTRYGSISDDPGLHMSRCHTCNGTGKVYVLDPKLMWQDCPGNEVWICVLKRTSFSSPRTSDSCPCGGTARVPTEYHLETLLAASPYHVRTAIIRGVLVLLGFNKVANAEIMAAAITAAETAIKEVQA